MSDKDKTVPRYQSPDWMRREMMNHMAMMIAMTPPENREPLVAESAAHAQLFVGVPEAVARKELLKLATSDEILARAQDRIGALIREWADHVVETDTPEDD